MIIRLDAVGFRRGIIEGSRYIVAIGLVGAVGGGFWTGLAFERLISPTGAVFDLVALMVAGLLTLTVAWYVWRSGSRVALLFYLVVASVTAAVGPALVF